MSKLIGYVGTKDLAAMREDDIRALDVINIAFGHLADGAVVWDGEAQRGVLARIRSVNPGIKILLSVGGWGADGFSQAAASAQSRAKAAQSAAAVAADYGLDGIDIDWEYPGTSLAGIASSPADGENYALFLGALRAALDSLGAGHMLTVAAGGDVYFTRLARMDLAAPYLDYVQLMTYDLQGGFQKATGHHAALYHSGRNLLDACGDKAVRGFLAAGVPAEKLVLGVPFYSRQWQGVAGAGDGLGAEAQTVGGYGPDYGALAEGYINQNGFARYWDAEAVAPWLFDGSTFISYDDEQSLAVKAAYVKEKGLYGMMYWEYRCDSTHTLTTFLRAELDK